VPELAASRLRCRHRRLERVEALAEAEAARWKMVVREVEAVGRRMRWVVGEARLSEERRSRSAAEVLVLSWRAVKEEAAVGPSR